MSSAHVIDTWRLPGHVTVAVASRSVYYLKMVCRHAIVTRLQCVSGQGRFQDKDILRAGLATAYLAELLPTDKVRDLLPQVRFKKV